MAYPADVHLFVNALRARLGPQLRNVPLLYSGAPELKDILTLYDLSPQSTQEALAATELRARFQLLVEAVLGVIAEIKLLALFLDDLQFADDA
jgi:predicted ATPase